MGPGGGAQTHLGGLGIGGERGIFHHHHLVVKHLLHAGLADAEAHDVVGHDDLVGQAPQIRRGATAEHGLALKGRAGQHQHMDAAALKGAAGGGAHGIVEHGAAHRQIRLPAVVLRHLPVERFPVKGPQIFHHIGMAFQRQAEHLADSLLGEIVIGGAEAAGGDDDIRPLPGDLQRLPETDGVVTHHGVPVNADAQCAQFPGQELCVAVGDVAQQDLGAHGDDLCFVCHVKSSLRRGRRQNRRPAPERHRPDAVIMLLPSAP